MSGESHMISKKRKRNMVDSAHHEVKIKKVTKISNEETDKDKIFWAKAESKDCKQLMNGLVNGFQCEEIDKGTKEGKEAFFSRICARNIETGKLYYSEVICCKKCKRCLRGGGNHVTKHRKACYGEQAVTDVPKNQNNNSTSRKRKRDEPVDTNDLYNDEFEFEEGPSNENEGTVDGKLIDWSEATNEDCKKLLNGLVIGFRCEKIITKTRIGNEPSFWIIGARNIETNELHRTNVFCCWHCSKWFRKYGSHLTNHRKTCSKRPVSQVLPTERNTLLSEAVSSFIVSSGQPLSLTEDPSFQALLVSAMQVGKSADGDFQSYVPEKETVKNLIETKKDDMKKLLTPFVKSGQASLTAEFSKIHKNMLLVKMSFIEETENEHGELKWILKTFPIATKLITKSKWRYSTNINLFINIFREYGWTDDELLDCSLTSNETELLCCLGNEFLSGHVRCFGDFAESVGNQMLDLSFVEERGEEYINNITESRNFVINCSKLSNLYNKSQEMKSLLRIEIRQKNRSCWFSTFDCITDIYENIEIFSENMSYMSEKMKSLVILLNESINRKRANNLLRLMEPLQKVKVIAQEEGIGMHNFLKCYLDLFEFFENEMDDTMSDEARYLCFSAIRMLEENAFKISKQHCAAFFLCPSTKDVSKLQEIFDRRKIDKNIEELAIKYIKRTNKIFKEIDSDLLLKNGSDANNPQPSPSSVDLTNPQPLTLQEEIEMYKNEGEAELEEFWISSKTSMPKLYRVAKKLYGSLVAAPKNEQYLENAKKSLSYSLNDLEVPYCNFDCYN